MKKLKNNDHNTVGIAIAWPETLCKQTDAWYDPILKWFQINKNGYYKVGHAAVIIVDPVSKECKYFDFGRYHAPAGYGRVRSFDTDTELFIKTRVDLDDINFTVRNLSEILKELHLNSAYHGSGAPFASQTAIRYETAIEKAEYMQNRGIIKYGPFTIKGTNCSRFVQSVLIAGMKLNWSMIKIKFPWTISPLPIYNVKCLKNPMTL